MIARVVKDKFEQQSKRSSIWKVLKILTCLQRALIDLEGKVSQLCLSVVAQVNDFPFTQNPLSFKQVRKTVKMMEKGRGIMKFYGEHA